MVEVPQDKVAWLSDFRLGKVQNVYEWVDCPESNCVCEFDNLADLVIHCVAGIGQSDYSKNKVHGSFGDRLSEEHRRKFKYFTRQRRVKERIYLAQSQNHGTEQESPKEAVQETLK